MSSIDVSIKGSINALDKKSPTFCPKMFDLLIKLWNSNYAFPYPFHIHTSIQSSILRTTQIHSFKSILSTHIHTEILKYYQKYEKTPITSTHAHLNTEFDTDSVILMFDVSN